MLNRKKHGFTVVELVIVIAVIAILAAVLIPTFIGIVNSAKKSADTTLIRNLNTALKTDKPDGKHENMSDALAAVSESGYDVAKINKTMLEGHQIVWDSERGVFAYMDTTGSNPTFEYVPDSNYTALPEDQLYKYWVIASEPDTKFSTYLYNYKGGTTVTVPNGVGLDVGAENVTEVKVAGDSAHDVTVYTTKGTMTVDAPNAIVRHYGAAEQVTVTAVASASYHEYGKVINLSVKKGHVVVESSADLGMLVSTADNTDDVSIKLADGVKVPVYGPEGTKVEGGEVSGTPDEIPANAIGKGTAAEPYLIATAEQALDMKNSKGYFKLVADIVVPDEIYLSGKAYTLDLNGHSLTLEYGADAKPNNGSVLYIGGKNGKLTINDSSADQSGEVIGSDKSYPNKVTSAVRAGNYSTLTINGGHFYGKSEATSCIFVYTNSLSSSKATVVINGGIFEVASPNGSTYYVLNHQDSSTASCTITVNGGKFKNYNPGVTPVDANNTKTGKISLGTGCTTTIETEGSDTWYIVSK